MPDGVRILGYDSDNKLYRNVNVFSDGSLGTSVNGNITATIGSGASDLGKIQGTSFSSGDVGAMSLVVRKDNLETLAGASRQYTPLEVNSSGALYTCNSGVQNSNNTSLANVGGQTTINEGGTFAAGDTTLTVTDGTVFTNGQTIKIDSEYLIISNIATNDLTVSRGNFNSTDASHDDGATITGVFVGASALSNYPDVTVSLKSDTTGTLYFDFSNDNTLWDTYPVTGFAVAANIHEYHTAVKNSRYFRVRFENGSASQTTSFRVYTYFGDFKLGKLPLNQSIGSDQDSIVVRSVAVGETPQGTYDNSKQDGSAFRTTSNLQGTTLTSSLSDSAVGTQNIFASTSGFAPSGYIYINSEFIQYDSVDSETQLTLTTGGRGSFGSSAATHASSDTVGEVYTSGILTLDGYTEVATKLLCSNTGRIRFQWYSDSAGSDLIRTIGPPYSLINTYDFLASPNFGPYARYTFANTQSTATTDLYFESEFYTKSISAQVLTLDSNMVTGMTANVTRSVLVGQNKAGTFINSPVDTSGNLNINVKKPRTAFGQLSVASENVLISEYYPYNINTRKITSYSLGTSVLITTTSGSGTDLNIEYGSSSGVITKLFPYGISRGTNYAVGDTINIPGGTSGQGTIESVDSSGGVLAISLTTPGTGYTDTTSTITQENSMIKLTTQAAANRKATARTVSTAKYQPGSGMVTRFTGLFATGTSGVKQYIGIGDENDGYFVGYQGTDFGILRRNNGTETFTTQSNFNIDVLGGQGEGTNPSNLNINFQTGNVFEIRFQWLGFGAITYSVEDPVTGELEPFHIIRYANANSVPSVNNPTFPISYEIENVSNTSALSLFSPSCMAALEGTKKYSDAFFSVSLVNTATANGVLIIRNREYYKEKINKTNVIIKEVNLANTNTANNAPTKTFTFTLNGTFSTTPTYNNVDDDTSVVEYHNTANTSVTVSGGIVINKRAVPGSDARSLRFDPGELVIRPGESLHIIGSGTQYDYGIDVVWVEDQ